MRDPEIIFSKASWRVLTGFADITSFRSITDLGMPLATAEIRKQSYELSNYFATARDSEKFFTDRAQFLKVIGGIEGLTNFTMAKRIEAYQTAIDCASIVSAHSVVDSCLYDFCEVTSLVSPESWEQFLLKRTISLVEIKGKTYDEILIEKVGQSLKDFEYKSLLEKVDRLFQICTPPQNYEVVSGFHFDRKRLLGLDESRHSVVHGSVTSSPLSNGPDDLLFMQNSALHLMGIVSNKFNIKIDPNKI